MQSAGKVMLTAFCRTFSSSFWTTGQQWMQVATAQHYNMWRKPSGGNNLACSQRRWYFFMTRPCPILPVLQCNLGSRLNRNVLTYPPYGLDLAPGDFYLFGPLWRKTLLMWWWGASVHELNNQCIAGTDVLITLLITWRVCLLFLVLLDVCVGVINTSVTDPCMLLIEQPSYWSDYY